MFSLMDIIFFFFTLFNVLFSLVIDPNNIFFFFHVFPRLTLQEHLKITHLIQFQEMQIVILLYFLIILIVNLVIIKTNIVLIVNNVINSEYDYSAVLSLITLTISSCIKLYLLLNESVIRCF